MKKEILTIGSLLIVFLVCGVFLFFKVDPEIGKFSISVMTALGVIIPSQSLKFCGANTSE
jgi:hypothetical protein